MAASLFASALYGQLFPTGAVGQLWSDSAEVRAMLLVEGALAKAQGAQGVIPEISAAFIHRAAHEVQIDPAGLAEATGQNGVSVPGLVAAFRATMEAPEHAQYVHWGATSQDIADTALMLRLRQTLAALEDRLTVLLKALASQAALHTDTPLPARTYGQHATLTTWGAVLAQWGHPLMDALEALPRLREECLWVSLSGAAGTASVLGPDAPATREAMAVALKLRDPGRSWHTDRGPILRITAWMAEVTAALGAMGAGLIGHAASDVAEVRFDAAGGSSTMPQKQNPVGPSVLVALDGQMAGLRASLQNAARHQFQRDGAAWFTEWLVLPQIALATAASVETAVTVAQGLQPDTARMLRNAGGLGLVHAETLSFWLAETMPRPEAQAAVKALVARVLDTGRTLAEVATDHYPDLPEGLFVPMQQTGHAPFDAQEFVKRVSAL